MQQVCISFSDIIFWIVIEVDTKMIVVKTLKGKYKLTQHFINYKGADWPFTNKTLNINLEILILVFEQRQFFILFLVFVNLVLCFSKQKWGRNEHNNTLEQSPSSEANSASGSQEICRFCMERESSLKHFITCWFLFNDEEFVTPHPLPKSEDYPLSAVGDCLFVICSICSCHPCLEAVSPINILRIFHAMLKRTHLKIRNVSLPPQTNILQNLSLTESVL
jgi:hypothetical protein